MIMAVSQELFRTEIIINSLTPDNSGLIEFEIINKSINQNSEAFEKLKTAISDNTLSTSPNSLFFSVETLCEALPFHFIFKRNFRIIQMGNSLKRYINKESFKSNQNKIMFSDLFIVSKPIVDLEFDSIVTYSNHLFILITRDIYIKQKPQTKNLVRKERLYSLTEVAVPKKNNIQLQLKGQMIFLITYDALLFIGSPYINNIKDMIDLNLTMSDFPIADPTGRHIILRALQQENKNSVNKIDVAANHLKIVEKKLRLEIAKNHKILHEIFPVKIARILCQNIKVDAEYFDHVTCLYSDVVNFTAMCSSPNMKAIDIIRLLNKLVSKDLVPKIFIF